MNYKLQLFKNIEFSPDDNMIVGTTAELESYLSFRLVFSTTTQNLIRFRPTISVVVNTGDYSLTYLAIEYCEITAPGTAGRTKWFYFVDSVEFVSRNAIRVNRSIDYLNTFYNSVSFGTDCHIVRRFKDRWLKTTNGYYPIYDKASEGFDITQILNKDKTLTIKDYQDDPGEPPYWLLAIAQVTHSDRQGGAVRYYPILPETKRIKANGMNISSSPSKFETKNLIVASTNINDIVSGEQFTEGTHQTKGLRCYLLPYYPPALGEATGTTDNLVFDQPSNIFYTWQWALASDNDNIALHMFFQTTLLGEAQQTALPEVSKVSISRSIYSGVAFNINRDYLRQQPTGNTKEERQEERRSWQFSVDRLDPKLGTSEFTGLKFEYLGATFTIAPENQDGGTYGGVQVEYSVSPNSDSPVRFKINPLNWNMRNKYSYTDDDRGYLIPSGDMSYPMAGSEYNQYLRFSNKYDKTSTALSYANIAGGAGSAIGSGAIGLAVGGPVGAVVAGVAGATFSAITSAIGTWNNQQARIQSEKQKSMNISQSSSDFNIIQTKNRARFLTYEIPEYLKRSLTRYFHLFGYAEDRYADPHVYDHKRCAFDFLTMDFVDYNKSEIEPAFRDGFEEKRKDGFYIMHVLQDLTPTSFDFRKANANREISLIEGRD